MAVLRLLSLPKNTADSEAPHVTSHSTKMPLNWAHVKSQAKHAVALVGIKLVHTAVWLFFAGCIVAIPIVGAMGRFLPAAVLSGLVLFECVILAANRGRCPLTDLAEPYTDERADNFDIYLPPWLARHNKTIFGSLFVLGELFLLWRWLVAPK
jgi:hypothetical protein